VVSRYPCAVVLCLLLCMLGCGGRRPTPNPAVYPARGKIFLDGAAVRYGRVCLTPKDPGRGVRCWGNIGPDGVFVLRTFMEEDGAAPGEYVVWVEPYSPAINGPASGKPSIIPARYQDVQTSGLTLTVGEDGDELPPLQLKR
jgi:hypothetical protein